MRFYALLHVPTGCMMPARTTVTGTSIGGHTHWDPHYPSIVGNHVGPRLFTRRSAANRARLAWLAGPRVRVYVENGRQSPQTRWEHHTPVRPRHPQDFVVVEVELSVIDMPVPDYRVTSWQDGHPPPQANQHPPEGVNIGLTSTG